MTANELLRLLVNDKPMPVARIAILDENLQTIVSAIAALAAVEDGSDITDNQRQEIMLRAAELLEAAKEQK